MFQQQGVAEVMKVQKRNGELEVVSFDEILRRMIDLCSNPAYGPALIKANAYEISKKVCARICDGIKTSQLDELAAQLCGSLVSEHPDYGTLAARIAISDLHKTTPGTFAGAVKVMSSNVDPNGRPAPLISDELIAAATGQRAKDIEAAIDYGRDYRFDYFGYRTLEKSYLTRVGGAVVERPQHLFMRVALGIHGITGIDAALDTYADLSMGRYVHATPTLFNAGTRVPQMSSCFVVAMREDSIGGMYRTLEDCAQISKHAGGIGLHVHCIRARGSYIRGTNGTSSGLLPMLRVYNASARHVNQAGKRNGSIAVYLEPWHADVESFLDIRKNHGNEDERARDLFPALWVPDLFMERVRDGGDWSLMCPDQCPGLSDAYGDEFKALYERYEAAGKHVKVVKAQDLWAKLLVAQTETGTPFLLFKDAINKKCNQRNVGTIKSSNLCCEITEYSSPDEQAVCNLASLCLPSFVTITDVSDTAKTKKEELRQFNFNMLHNATRSLVRNLNKVIDRGFYPTVEARRGNMRNRPIGIGVQGLADTFAILKLPYDSAEAAKLNRDIFETIYHAAVSESVALAEARGFEIKKFLNDAPFGWRKLPRSRQEELGTWCGLYEGSPELAALSDKRYPFGAYASFVGSPASEGLLQFDLWGIDPGQDRYDWASLKERVKRSGMRNSLLLAPMPTASTSQIMGCNECFEPFTSNLYKRKTLAGEYIVVNKHLVRDLEALGLWGPEMKERIVVGDGSIQGISEIPQNIKALYKTVWEIKQRVLIDMAAARGAFICQSQSMNLFVEDPDQNKLTAMLFYSWGKGLKTGMYYLRTKPKSMAQQFTVDPRKARSNVITPPLISPPMITLSPTSQRTSDEEEEEEEHQQAVGCQWKPGCKTCSS